MELMEKDLNQLMKRKKGFSETHLVKIVYNSLCALAFLHEANVMHRDIKPSNMLIDSHCNIKICDYGLSRTLPSNNMGAEGPNAMHVRDEFFEQHQNEVYVSKYD